MKRRREHGECETRVGGRGCLVLGTSVCTFRKEKLAFEILKRRVRRCLRGDGIVWWAVIALLGVALAVAGGWWLDENAEVGGWMRKSKLTSERGCCEDHMETVQ
jgi:hypothetical protein